ncbi:MAG TPA: hypothetical protein VGM88_12210 [Kofleriaceae bacterium]|jgi:hypothetical protein
MVSSNEQLALALARIQLARAERRERPGAELAAGAAVHTPEGRLPFLPIRIEERQAPLDPDAPSLARLCRDPLTAACLSRVAQCCQRGERLDGSGADVAWQAVIAAVAELASALAPALQVQLQVFGARAERVLAASGARSADAIALRRGEQPAASGTIGSADAVVRGEHVELEDRCDTPE